MVNKHKGLRPHSYHVLGGRFASAVIHRTIACHLPGKLSDSVNLLKL